MEQGQISVSTQRALATIRASDLPLVIAAAKLRRYTNGRTCQLCALSEGPTIEVGCMERLRYGVDFAERAKRFGLSPARVMPMQRGDIGRVYERVQREHGRREVVKTWGAGIQALQAEPLYVLNGGAP